MIKKIFSKNTGYINCFDKNSEISTRLQDVFRILKSILRALLAWRKIFWNFFFLLSHRVCGCMDLRYSLAYTQVRLISKHDWEGYKEYIDVMIMINK